MYRQCQLVKILPKEKQHLTSWIPEEFARVGAVLKLKDNDSGEWDNDWKVALVGGMRRTHEEVVIRSRDYVKQRGASDI